MKKRILALLLAVTAVFLLAGCTQKRPTETSAGEPFDENWTLVGTTVGIENPPGDFFLLDNKDALTASGLYYATWATGTPQEYVNQEGETVDLYDAQLYVLLQDFNTEQEAADRTAQWKEKEEETYLVQETFTLTCSNQEYTVLVYETTSQDNPYSFGVSAFTSFGTHGINIELACLDSFTGNALDILEEFLNGFHFV